MKKQLLLVTMLCFGAQVLAEQNDKKSQNKSQNCSKNNRNRGNRNKNKCNKNNGPIVGTVEATGEGATGVVKSAGEGAVGIVEAIFPGLKKNNQEDME